MISSIISAPKYLLQDDYGSSKELEMYLQFNVILRDVSAFLVDGDYHWSQDPANKSSGSSHLDYVNFLPVIDNCGVILKLQQV